MFLASSLLLPGCDSSSVPLRLGTNVWPGYEPLYLAREQGYLNPDDVKLVELPSATDVMDALRLGHLEAGALTLDEVLTLVAEGEQLSVILVFDISAGADVVMARTGIEGVSDLAGHTIAVETTAVGALMLKSALEMGELKADEIKVVHLPLTDHLKAFRAQRIDAAVTFYPYAADLEKAGAHKIFDSSAIEGQIVDVLAVRSDLLSSRKRDIESLLKAYYQALADITNHPQAMLPMLNKRLQLSAEEVPHILDGLILPDYKANLELLSGHPSKLDRSAQTLSEVMARQRLLARPLFIDKLTFCFELEGMQ